MKFETVTGLLFAIVFSFENKTKKLPQNTVVATVAYTTDLTELTSSTKGTSLQHSDLPRFLQTPSNHFSLQLCVCSVTASRVLADGLCVRAC